MIEICNKYMNMRLFSNIDFLLFVLAGHGMISIANQAKKSMSSFEATHRKLHKNLKTMEVECTSLAEEQDDLKSQCQAFETECEKIQSNLVRL